MRELHVGEHAASVASMRRAPAEAFVPYREAQPHPRIRLLCFPHAGGAASTFRGWQKMIGEDVEIWAIQLPGREGRRHEAPHRHIASAIEELIAGLGPRMDQPFALFGHSVGADLAYALALELRRRGLRAPEHVIVAAQVPPHHRQITDPLHLLDDAALLARLEGHGGIPEELLAHRDALDLALPRLRADLEMTETFAATPADRLDVPLTAFGGLHDRAIHGPDVPRWGDLTSARFHVEWWHGDHFFVHADAEEVVAQLHSMLSASMRVAQERAEPSAAWATGFEAPLTAQPEAPPDGGIDVDEKAPRETTGPSAELVYFVVPERCLGCGACASLAPATLAMGDSSACVIRQPVTPEELSLTEAALFNCPVLAIHKRSRA